MQIESPKRSYTIIRRLITAEQEEIYLCKESGGKDEKQYSVVKMCDSHLAYSIIPMFLSWTENRGFFDYIECFNLQGTLYLVFLHHEETSLEQKLEKNQLTLEERLLVLKGILSNIMLQSIPLPIVWELLQCSNLLVADDLSVHFEYTLLMFEVYSDITMLDIQDRFRELLMLMFQEELELHSLPELEVMVGQLKEHSFLQMVDLYGAYNELCTVLFIRIKEGQVKPRQIWVKIWEVIKEVYHKVKVYVILGIVIVLALYLIHMLINRTDDAVEKTVFHYIGDVTINTEK